MEDGFHGLFMGLCCKKTPAENKNSEFRMNSLSFLHSDFLSFTSGYPVLVKEDEPEKGLNAGFVT
ncbi:MAG: hypothetical protein ACLVKK_02095 [Ruthenibacterium sp.]